MEENDLKKISCYGKECSVGNNGEPISWNESPGLILIQLLREKESLRI